RIARITGSINRACVVYSYSVGSRALDLLRLAGSGPGSKWERMFPMTKLDLRMLGYVALMAGGLGLAACDQSSDEAEDVIDQTTMDESTDIPEEMTDESVMPEAMEDAGDSVEGVMDDAGEGVEGVMEDAGDG